MRYKFNDITLYYYPEGDDALNFTKRQNDVSSRYVELLNGYKPKGTTRISVELAEEDDIRFFVGSVLLAEAAFDKNAYWKLDHRSQNLMILDTIHRIASLCADKFIWDKEHFTLAYQTALAELCA